MAQVKRLYSFFASLALLFTFCLSACSMHVAAERDRETVEYGSLTVSNGGTSSSRSLEVDEIGFAKVFVTGYGIEKALESDFVGMTGGAGSASVEKIPVGDNRIVTVQAYDATKKPIEGAIVRNIVNIKAGDSNSCPVTQASTPLANVFVKLLDDGTDISKIDTSDSSIIKTFFEGNELSWSLIDTDAIAVAFKSNPSSLSTASIENYKKATGTVSITSSITDGSYTLQISDPSSEKKALSSSSSSIDNAAPGTWNVRVLDGSTVKASGTIKVVSGETTTINVSESTGGSVTGKIIVHVPSSYGFQKAHYWGGDAGSTAWPGASMTLNGDVYDLELDGATKTNIIFNNGTDGQTKDLYVSEGEWNYNGSNVETTSDVTLNFTKVQHTSGEKSVSITVTNPNGSECIIVHGKYTHIWAWETGNESNNYTGGTWPGAAMTEEADGWYTYTLNHPAADVILYTSDSERSKPDDQGGDSLTTGEWWFDKTNKKWCDSNPDDAVAPVLVSFTSDKTGTVTGDVVFTVSATDNLSLSKAVIKNGATELASINMSGSSATETYTWKTSKLQNGTYSLTATVYDAAGNASSTSSPITFTTNNENLPPIAKISGSTKVRIGKSITYSAGNSEDQNGGTIASYAWTVTGATATSALNQKELTITVPSSVGANFTVTLVVTDNDGASSETVSMDCTTIDVDPNWDFRDETIYFLMTTRFYDGDSSNNRYCWGDQQFLWSEDHNDPGWRGDFKGLIEKLDYIKALGFTAIWITPVVENASDLDYHGYHATDFSKVDPRYESTGVTYQTLIDACHDKGLKVIQDIVLNHCSNAGERNILPMTVKDYNGDVRVYNGVKYSVPMVLGESACPYKFITA